MKRGAQLREALFISSMVVLASVVGIWGRGLGFELYIGLLGLVALAGVVLVLVLRSRQHREPVSFLHVPAEDPAQEAVVAGVHYPEHRIVSPEFQYQWQVNSNADGNVVGALHHHEGDLVGAELTRVKGGFWAKCQCGADTGVPERMPTAGTPTGGDTRQSGAAE